MKRLLNPYQAYTLDETVVFNERRLLSAPSLAIGLTT